MSQTLWSMPVIPSLWQQRHLCEFEASLDYIPICILFQNKTIVNPKGAGEMA